MLSLLERAIAKVERRLILVAPPDAVVPRELTRTTDDAQVHQAFVHQVQRLRGGVYVADGAIRPEQLSSDGRYSCPEDRVSWHLMMVGEQGLPSGCLWYRNHDRPAGIEQLRIRRCPLNRDARWRPRLHTAVASDIAQAGSEGIHYAEIGGWAVNEETRRTPDGILLALSVFALAQALGDAIGITTATTRHSSSAILRRLGGTPLETQGESIPAYYDPYYRCEMELLRFDSRQPGVRYADAIDVLLSRLPGISVVTRPALNTANTSRRASGDVVAA